GAEFAADEGSDVLDQLRMELIGLSFALLGKPALLSGFFGTVLAALAGSSSWVSCVSLICNLSCRKGRMLPHTGLFLLWKVALQI
ncbi:hypothetical protein AKG43_10900, partial [Neisseria sp. 74A18]